MTIGEKRMVMSYSPINDEQKANMLEVKKKCSELINIIEGYKNSTQDKDSLRWFSIAQKDIETGGMFAVKGVTNG